MAEAKLSIVIPTYTINRELESMTENCIISYQDQVDEIIVVEDGGMLSVNLQRLADTYIYHKDNYGYTKNINMGWKIAVGDFVALVNSDTYLRSGELKDLCVPGRVTSPLYQNQDWGDEGGGLSGSFFVVPKEIQQERGYLNEALRMWQSDSEYNDRVQDIFTRIPTVTIYHEIEATTKASGVGTEEARQKDFNTFHNI